MSTAQAVVRARADLAAGRPDLARRRLRDLVRTNPADWEARRMLMHIYRDAGYPDEAGRWGYLLPGEARLEELRAYEKAGVYRVGSHRRHTYVRKGLFWPPGTEPENHAVAELLVRLDERVQAEARTNRPFRGARTVIRFVVAGGLCVLALWFVRQVDDGPGFRSWYWSVGALAGSWAVAARWWRDRRLLRN